MLKVKIASIIKDSVKEHMWPFFFFITIGLGLIVVTSQSGRQLFGSDTALMQYGQIFSERMLKSGNFPYWNPYINGGMPHMCALSSLIFFPTFFSMYLMQFPIHQIFLYNCVIAIIFAAFFMYLFVRYLGFSKLTGCISGMFFCLSGSFFTYINPGHDVMMLSLVFLPASFYFITRGIREDKLYHYILAGSMLALQSLTIMYQMTFYTVMCLTAYFLYVFFSEKKKFKHLLYFLLAGVFVLLVSAVQFAQSVDYLKYSFRSGVNYDFFSAWSFHPTETIVYLYPKFFGFLESTYWGRSQFWLSNDYLGILPLIFVFAGIFFERKKRTMWFFVSMAACVLVLAFGSFTPLHKLLFKIPVVNGFRNSSRWLGFFSFSLIIVASFGIEYILNYCREKVTAESALRMKKFLLSLLIAGGVAFLIHIIFAGNRDAMVSNIKGLQQFAAKFQPKDQDFVSQIMYLMIKEDMFLLWIHILAGLAIIFVTVKGWFPRGAVFLACVLFVVLDNGVLFMQEHVYEIGVNQYKTQCVKTEPEGQEDPRREEINNALKTDTSLFRIMPIGDLFTKNWFTADNMQSCGGYHNAPLSNYTVINEKGLFSYISFLSLFNVKYLITADMINHPALKLVYDGKVKIFQNITNLPRAFLSSKAVKVSDEEIVKIFQNQRLDSNEIIYLNEELNKPLDNVKYTGNEVKVTDFQPNSVKLEAESKGNSVLFLSEVYYPEWKAYVDGKETRIYQAFGLFRAIYLEKGTHRIEFVFNPAKFYVGAAITVFTVIFVIVFGIFAYRRRLNTV